MTQITLGRTGISVNKNGFGGLPIQRISKDDAAYLLRKAFDNGITFFDTARAYTDSEEKIGYAFEGMRDKLYISTKSMAVTADKFWDDLHASLKFLKTDYVDIMQFHNPSFCPRPGDESGLYDAVIKAQEQGKVRFVGLTNHRLHVAAEAIESGLYDTLQFPFCYLATEKDIEIVKACEKADIGFIAMKALSGGLITNSAAAYAYLDQFPGVLPIWGVQREEELDDFISYVKNPPKMTDEMESLIRREREELLGNFCRGCGYCMPCPVGIEINNCARMSLLIRRSPSAAHLTPEAQEKMKKIEECLHCGKCMEKCPYGLNTPELLEENYKDYCEILNGKAL